MTESIKQRMEELASPYTSGQKLVFKAGYLAGLSDPDANKAELEARDGEIERLKLACVNAANDVSRIGDEYNNQNILVCALKDEIAIKDEAVEKREAENKKLREAMQFAVDHLSSMGYYSVVNGAIYCLREALSSEGEKL